MTTRIDKYWDAQAPTGIGQVTCEACGVHIPTLTSILPDACPVCGAEWAPEEVTPLDLIETLETII